LSVFGFSVLERNLREFLMNEVVDIKDLYYLKEVGLGCHISGLSWVDLYGFIFERTNPNRVDDISARVSKMVSEGLNPSHDFVEGLDTLSSSEKAALKVRLPKIISSNSVGFDGLVERVNASIPNVCEKRKKNRR